MMPLLVTLPPRVIVVELSFINLPAAPTVKPSADTLLPLPRNRLPDKTLIVWFVAKAITPVAETMPVGLLIVHAPPGLNVPLFVNDWFTRPETDEPEKFRPNPPPSKLGPTVTFRRASKIPFALKAPSLNATSPTAVTVPKTNMVTLVRLKFMLLNVSPAAGIAIWSFVSVPS